MNKKAERRKRHEMINAMDFEEVKRMWVFGAVGNVMKKISTHSPIPKTMVEDYKFISKHFKKLKVELSIDEIRSILGELSELLGMDDEAIENYSRAIVKLRKQEFGGN